MSVQFNFNSLKYNNISHFENQNGENIGFQGLNRCLSRDFVNGGRSKITGFVQMADDAVMEAIKNHPKSRRFVGNLPPDWIDQIPKGKRKETVQQIQDLFSGLAEKLYSPQGTRVNKDETFVVDFLSQLKQSLGLDTEIKYIHAGDIGKAYKLKVGDKKYVFKAFHSDMNPDYAKSNGEIFEPARAPYANKKGCKSFVDFYFGRIGTHDNHDGFMLTKFETSNQKFTPGEEIKRLLRMLKSRVVTADISIKSTPQIPDDLNIIGLKAIDLGDLTLLSQNLHKALKKTAKDIEKYYFNTKKNLTNKEVILNQINDIRQIFGCFCINRYVEENLQNTLRRLTELLKTNKSKFDKP
ncbi:MAG: hypothetical protein A2039_07995 [Candidatus Melainabacteria bacterium GWA2_34_9]|nr:MAG: hypothetical protein A2039_07995 [Candidatus Melainabacteria bacterium GWA2_34_9]